MFWHHIIIQDTQLSNSWYKTGLPYLLHSKIKAWFINAAYLIIIIINLYGAYILRNLSSEAQQNRIIKHNREQGRAKVSIRMRDNRTFMVEIQFGIGVLSFFRKIAIVSRFKSDREFIPDPRHRHSDRESAFTQVKFCFMYNKLL